MKFSIEKGYLLNRLKVVEKIASMRGINPILSNILIEACEDNKIKLTSTDMDMSVETTQVASVDTPGSTTMGAKKLIEIVNKLPDKPILFELDNSTQIMQISCGSTKYEVISMESGDFPKVFKDIYQENEIEIETEPFIKGIEHTVFACASPESRNVISGVIIKVRKDNIEMAATDGNRLTRLIQQISEKEIEDEITIIIPSKALNEFARICQITEDKKVKIIITKVKVIFKTENFILESQLLDGDFPPYSQLIPKSFPKNVIVDRDDFLNALDRVSTMVSDRTSIIEFCFTHDKIKMLAQTPEEGKSNDEIDVEYQDGDLEIAFNYKYIVESIKNMDSEKIQIGLNGSLSATMFTPVNDDDYICLIMPVQLKDEGRRE
ncbi:MAG: DNA polymerase III subunit beta [Candidatus Gastranaerophilales bacterium]|nr:DNA polymerase III subunit beta [Candidatus Gastranaerophilales bacterium]